MAGRPLISVIVPVYQCDAGLLGTCLDSVGNQGIDSDLIEACVVFDGEPDHSLLEVVNIRKSTQNIRCNTQEHSGVSVARNNGISMARGVWLAFVDADDYLPSNALQTLLGNGESRDIVIGAHEVLYPNGSVEIRHYGAGNNSPLVSAGQIKEDLLKPGMNLSPVWGKLFRRQFVLEHHLEFRPDIRTGEDTEFVFRAALETDEICYVDRGVYCYRRTEGSAVRGWKSDYVDRILQSMEAVNEVIQQYDLGKPYRCAYADYVAFHIMLILVHYLFNPQAPWAERQRKAEFCAVLNVPLFDWALRRYNPRDFSRARQIALLCLKHRTYPLCKIIGSIRQRQLD